VAAVVAEQTRAPVRVLVELVAAVPVEIPEWPALLELLTLVAAVVVVVVVLLTALTVAPVSLLLNILTV
jgi:hypothetical protein